MACPHLPQQRLYLRPERQGQGPLRLWPSGPFATGAVSMTGRPRKIRVVPAAAPAPAAPPAGAAGAAAAGAGGALGNEPPNAACAQARRVSKLARAKGPHPSNQP